MDIIYNEQDPLQAYLRMEEFYRLTTPALRAAICEGWNFGRHWSIPGMDYSDWDRIIFTPLFGEDTDGLDAQARIEARLTYHAISKTNDIRDKLMDICLCYHSGLCADLDIVSLFEETARISDEETAYLLHSFLRRKPEDKSLWAFGFRGVPFENGIAFEWIGIDDDYDNLKPTHLDSMGREMKV